MVVRAWGRGACVRILCATLWSGVVLQAEDLGASGSIERQEKLTDAVVQQVLRCFVDEGLFKENWQDTMALTRNASVKLIKQLAQFHDPCDDHGVDVCWPRKMAEVQNDPAEIKLPPGSPGIELGFTSHVRASPL